LVLGILAVAGPDDLTGQEPPAAAPPEVVYGDGFYVPVVEGFQLLVADTASAQFPPGTIAQLGERVLVLVQPRGSAVEDSALTSEDGCDRLRRGTAQERGMEDVAGRIVELARGRGCQITLDENLRRVTTIVVLDSLAFTVACTFDIGRETPSACDAVLNGLALGDAPVPTADVTEEPRTPIDDPPTAEQWSRVHMRMMMRQVREILGEPIKVVTTGLVAGEEWQFPGGGSVLFDRSGRVVSVERPRNPPER
jgi:hypothetical protein